MNLSKIPDKLPELPSKLIRVALRDLRKIQKDIRYEVCMSIFHSGGDRHRVCEVCLAGAVMACTLGVPRSRTATPTSFIFKDSCSFSYPTPEQTSLHRKLLAIDAFMSGHVKNACGYINVYSKLKDRKITPYDLNKARFFRDMSRLADSLAREGN